MREEEEGERKVHAIKLIATTLEYNDNPCYFQPRVLVLAYSLYFPVVSVRLEEETNLVLPESTFFHGRQ